MTNQIIRFDIIDRHTGQRVATASNRARATASVNRRDNAYGAYRYFARPIYGVTEAEIEAAVDAGHTAWLISNLAPKA